MSIIIAYSAGQQAAWYAAESIRRRLRHQSLVQVVFATGASQFELLENLIVTPNIDWSRVCGWHLDEYIGLANTHPASFSNYLRQRLVDRVPLHSFQWISGECADPDSECQRLGQLLSKTTIDLALVGIGENAHIAFNDPPADWETRREFLIVELDQACRQQQVNEGWFPNLDAVPRRAITMSCQQILRAREILCTVPEARKAPAVARCLTEPPTPLVPGSCLQTHPRINFILDGASSAQLPNATPESWDWWQRQAVLPCRLFDPQINGCFGVDFNDPKLSGEYLRTVAQRLENAGLTGILVTLITDDLQRLEQQILRIVSFCQQDDFLRSFVAGIHLEGPFLSNEPGYCGTHPRQYTLDANPDAMRRLLDAGQGFIRWVTLAPERDRTGATTRLLADQGLTVAAGHTNASLDELQIAIDQGLRVFTHLGNGCPAELPRHDNIINRALSLRDQLRFTLIADGIHLPDFLVRSWLELLGPDRVMLISDATAAAGCGPGTYRLGTQEIQIDAAGKTSNAAAPGVFAGGGLTLTQIAQRLTRGEDPIRPEVLESIAYRNAVGMVG